MSGRVARTRVPNSVQHCRLIIDDQIRDLSSAHARSWRDWLVTPQPTIQQSFRDGRGPPGVPDLLKYPLQRYQVDAIDAAAFHREWPIPSRA